MNEKNHVLMFKASADTLFRMKDYTSATILYFKTWFALHDYLLLKKLGITPKDHAERFRLLERAFPDEYLALDKEYTTYRDTYSRIISAEDCRRVREVVVHALEHHGIV
ncbi:MAG: hypothetical protein V1725_08215 [archaeon]